MGYGSRLLLWSCSLKCLLDTRELVGEKNPSTDYCAVPWGPEGRFKKGEVGRLSQFRRLAERLCDDGNVWGGAAD